MDRKIQINNPNEVINKLKVHYYEIWEPDRHKYMVLEAISGAVYFSNDLDCDGNMYFGYKSFLKVIKRWEEKLSTVSE